MTTPTAPDGDRLPATNSGQETCVCCGGAWQLVDRLCAECARSCLLDRCAYNPARPRRLPDGWAGLPRHRPAPQQPPAQEREVVCAGLSLCVNALDRHDRGCPRYPAPPSEADSAGEDAWDYAFRFGVAYFGRRLDNGLLTRTDISDMLMNAYRLGLEHSSALAASPGVQGGDGEARERLAAVLALHVKDRQPEDDIDWCGHCEKPWPCPTVRAAGGGRS